MSFARLLTALALGVASLGAASLAFADAAPICTQFDGNANCDAGSVGSACSGGGTCASVSCQGDAGTAATLYKCVTCPAVVDDTAGVCDAGGGAIGKACGDGGTCERFPGYCSGATGYATCAGPSIAIPTDAGTDGGGGGGGAGGSAGGTASDAGTAPAAGSGGSSGGCTASPTGKRGAFAAALTLAGLAALALGRKRRPA